MQVHFLHRNFRNTVVILEEGNPPPPMVPPCDILVPWSALNGRHIATAQCASGAERKRIQLAEEQLRECSERAFQDYGEPLENVTKFRYQVRVMTAGDDDWHAVVGNLHKMRNSWGRLSRILIREGTDPKVSGNFSRALTQDVLLFGAENWVLTLRWIKT